MSKGSTLVSVRLKNVPDNETYGVIVLGLAGNQSLVVRWIGPNELFLDCATCNPDNINFEVVKTGDIKVVYGRSLIIR